MPKSITMFLAVSAMSGCSDLPVVNDSKPKTVANQSVSNDLKNEKSDTVWVEIKEGNNAIRLNLVYSDTSNFTHTKLYPCARCYLRKEAAAALIKASAIAKNKGYKLRIFDCYRPYSVQVKMFELIGDERYVAKPGKGSMHNKGCAIDLSLEHPDGKPVDMGTAFDDFSEKASFNYPLLSNEQKKMRSLLRSIMTESGFKPYEAEWWHFNYHITDYPVADFKFNCD